MPFRTTIDTVRSLLQDEEANVYVSLQVANDLVDALLVGSGLSTPILSRIEAFLACHIYSLANPELVREEYDRARFQYVAAKVDEGFRSTKWGQMALALDTTGVLRGNNKVRVALHVL